MSGKKLAADALITILVLMIISGGTRTETSVQPGDVAGALGRLTALLLLLVGLFLSVRWRVKLSGHNYKVGRQAIAAILFWYSLLAILFGANAGERDSKTEAAGELSSAGDGQDNRQFGSLIERGGRDDKDGTMALLFVTEGGIERHGVNVSSFHRSSRPTAGASTHSRSSGGSGCE